MTYEELTGPDGKAQSDEAERAVAAPHQVNRQLILRPPEYLAGDKRPLMTRVHQKVTISIPEE